MSLNVDMKVNTNSGSVIIAQPLAQSVEVALVVSRFNEDITSALYEGARTRLLEGGIEEAHLTVVHVPGAIELSVTAQRLAETGRFSAVICLGAVIYGQTRHFDYVCEHVTQGCLHAALNTDVPVIFGVLTVEARAQAEARIGGEKGHKGVDAADCALEMISVMQQIDGLELQSMPVEPDARLESA